MAITREQKDELDLLGFKTNIINQQLNVQQCRIEDLDLEKSKLVAIFGGILQVIVEQ